MTAMTVKDLLDAKGKRQLAYVQFACEEDAIAASEAGMNMAAPGSSVQYL